MFTQHAAMSAREINSAHAKLTALLAARDHWYDGTVASIDSRIRAIDNALPFVSRVSGRDADMLAQTEALRDERRQLGALRREVLTSVNVSRQIPRTANLGKLDDLGRRFVATEVREFMADNADAVEDLDELDERAENHAEIKTMQLPVTHTEAANIVAHFRVAVNWNARNTPRPERRARRTASAADLRAVPDSALFD